MIKSLAFASVALFSSMSFGLETKTCAFPAMQNAPLTISIDGQKATVAAPGSPLNECSVASKAEISELNSKLASQGNKIGPIVNVLVCRDAMALSTYEIYLTGSSQIYFYMETQGLISGTCKN